MSQADISATATPPEAEAEEILHRHPAAGRAIDPKKLNLRDETLYVNRVAKVVKGGRRFSFAALVAVGDGNGHVGLGFGKANEVPDAISKAGARARKSLIRVPLMGRTIPHQVIGEHDSARVLLKPAAEGTGLIAGASIRTYLALAGVHDVLAKSLGSDNKLNVIKAVAAALLSLKQADEVAQLRGKKIDELIGAKAAAVFQNSKTSTLTAEDPEYAKSLAAQAAQAASVAAAAAAAPAETPTPDFQDEVPEEK